MKPDILARITIVLIYLLQNGLSKIIETAHKTCVNIKKPSHCFPPPTTCNVDMYTFLSKCLECEDDIWVCSGDRKVPYREIVLSEFRELTLTELVLYGTIDFTIAGINFFHPKSRAVSEVMQKLLRLILDALEIPHEKDNSNHNIYDDEIRNIQILDCPKAWNYYHFRNTFTPQLSRYIPIDQPSDNDCGTKFKLSLNSKSEILQYAAYLIGELDQHPLKSDFIYVESEKFLSQVVNTINKELSKFDFGINANIVIQDSVFQYKFERI